MAEIAEFLMLVGLPGSGKSTVSKQFEAEGYIVHSSDAIREELLGDINAQSNNDLVFNTLHKRIIMDLQANRKSIYDACNIDYKRRMQFLDMIKNIKCIKRCVLVATPYEVCLEQNRNRERNVPDYVIEKMYKNFHIPQYYEGWDEILIDWNFHPNDFKLYELFDGLNYMEQNNPYHTLTIGHHCRKCASEVTNLLMNKENIRITDIIDLKCASLLHDIGKPFCREYNEKKEYDTYYQHHLVSAYNSLFYLKSMRAVGDESILRITNYIMWHMQHFFMQSEKDIDKFKKLVGNKTYENIELLHEADLKAK